MPIRLVPPHERYRETFLRALREFQVEGLPWWSGGDLDLLDGEEPDFAAFVAKKLRDAEGWTGATPPKTHLWAIDDDERFVGRLSIFHELTDALRVSGGHIGYDTLPSLRGRGVATEMVRQALPIARSLGLAEVLLTCDETNMASIRVIEKNGGALRETRVLDPSRPAKRSYWIALG